MRSDRIWPLALITRPGAATLPDPVAGADRKALFGDLHMHIRRPFDAPVFTTRVTPDDAYGFATGKPLKPAPPTRRYAP